MPPIAVAVLCTAARARVAASAVALAAARTAGVPVALAGAFGRAGVPAGGVCMPVARRVAARASRGGLPAVSTGRLVWIADCRRPGEIATDPAGHAAAASSGVLRAAFAMGVPAAFALSLARTDGLDRVLSWFDAIVVVPEPDAAGAVLDRALASLSALQRPVAVMAPPARIPATLAAAGACAPATALGALAQLEIVRRDG